MRWGFLLGNTKRLGYHTVQSSHCAMYILATANYKCSLHCAVQSSHDGFLGLWVVCYTRNCIICTQFRVCIASLTLHLVQCTTTLLMWDQMQLHTLVPMQGNALYSCTIKIVRQRPATTYERHKKCPDFSKNEGVSNKVLYHAALLLCFQWLRSY